VTATRQLEALASGKQRTRARGAADMPLCRITRAALRAVLRDARALSRAGAPLLLAPPLTVEAAARGYGRGGAAAAAPAPGALLAAAFPGLALGGLAPATAALAGADVARAARALFREGGGGADAALAALARWHALRAAGATHSRAATAAAGGARVVVDVTTLFLPGLPLAAAAAAAHFSFAYRVRIANAGAARVQVVGRQWVFTDARGGAVEVPRGSPGVVGHAPVLEPGAAFEYVSGVALATPGGEMVGSFQMRTDAGAPFDARAARVLLRAPIGTGVD